MYNNENLIWNTIGGKEFCCFKYNSNSPQRFCKNEFNLTGFCSKQSCPLANHNYATVVQKNGILFLYFKTAFNIKFPNRNWKKISLSRNYIKAIQQIDLVLSLWPKFFTSKIKLRLTRLTQISIRTKIRNIRIREFFCSNFRSNLISNKEEFKLVEKMKTEKIIERELLNRLHMGVYGKNYNRKPIDYWKKLKNKNFKKIKNTLHSKKIIV